MEQWEKKFIVEGQARLRELALRRVGYAGALLSAGVPLGLVVDVVTARECVVRQRMGLPIDEKYLSAPLRDQAQSSVASARLIFVRSDAHSEPDPRAAESDANALLSSLLQEEKELKDRAERKLQRRAERRWWQVWK